MAMMPLMAVRTEFMGTAMSMVLRCSHLMAVFTGGAEIRKLKADGLEGWLQEQVRVALLAAGETHTHRSAKMPFTVPLLFVPPDCRSFQMSDADNFGCAFPASARPADKAVLLSAVFLLDFIFFESDGNGQSNRRGRGGGMRSHRY